MSTTTPVARPPADKEADKGPMNKAWKDVKWKIQPESYNVRKVMEHALAKAVAETESFPSRAQDVAAAKGWLTDLFDEGIYEKLFVDEHMGNFVIDRKTGIKGFEEQSLYVRIGMHLLFYGPAQIRLLRSKFVKELLESQSVKQGKIYDQEGPEVAQKIQDFIKTYELDMKDVLIQNISEYKTFNQFFSRKLKPSARKPADPKNNSVIVSAADCRLTVFADFDQARQFWVKGKKFTLPELLASPTTAARFGAKPSLAIFRLAPQDYHRFHVPVTGTIESITNVPGTYYTVNPQAVNEPLDVFTANRRDVCIINASLANSASGTAEKALPVAVVAIGALLVGSVGWDYKVGDQITKGDGLGYFQYGGSTVICVFPQEANVAWDSDILKASTGEWTGTEDPAVMASIPANAKIGPLHSAELFGLEMVVQAAEKIGVSTPAPPTSTTPAIVSPTKN